MESICIIQPKIENPIYTIAIPTYKRTNLLKEAIESALDQSYAGTYDVIVVDNNPDRDDETELMMMEYRDNARIGYYKNSVNLGMTGNWNRLYELARGKYVVMLHDDDLLYDYYLSVMDRFLVATHCRYKAIYPMRTVTRDRSNNFEYRPNKFSLSFKGIWRYFSNAKILSSGPHRIRCRERKWQDFSTGAILGIPSGMALEKETYKKTGPFVNDFFPIMDQEFAYRVAQNTNVCELKVAMFKYYIGVNESLNIDTIKKAFINYQKLYGNRITQELPYLWKIVNLICYRTICKTFLVGWECNWGDKKMCEEIIAKLGYRENVILDTLSMLAWLAVNAYLIIFRTKTVVLD